MPPKQSLWFRLGYALERAREGPPAAGRSLRGLAEQQTKPLEAEGESGPGPAWPSIDSIVASGASAAVAKVLNGWKPQRKASTLRLLRAGAAGAAAALLVDMLRPLIRGEPGVGPLDKETVDRLIAGIGQGLVYGAVVATMQRDLKRLVAYSSVAHLGFIILGTFSLNTEGLEGSLLQMVNHGVSTGALFLLVGMIYERRHTLQIDELGGLQKSAPVMAAVFTLVMLSSIGLPGLNGFVGEFLILLGAFNAHRWWAGVAASGVILAALYLLWAYQRVFHGPAHGDNAEMPDLRIREGLVLAPLLALIVFMGVYPKPVIERMEPSVDALVAHIETHVDGFHEPTSRFGADIVVGEGGDDAGDDH